MDLLEVEDVNNNGVLDIEDTNQNGVLDLGEDTNGNGVLDLGEDTNGNGVLDTEDTNGNGVLDTEDTNGNGVLDHEDANNDGSLTVANDLDLSGTADSYGLVPRPTFAKAEWSNELTASPYSSRLISMGSRGGVNHAPSTDGTSSVATRSTNPIYASRIRNDIATLRH